MSTPAPSRFVLDMVHQPPGSERFETSFLNPQKLKDWGFTGQVQFLFEAAQFGILWNDFDAQVMPPGSEAAHWVQENARRLHRIYNRTKEAGINLYCQTDMIILPKELVGLRKKELCNAKGRLDLSKPLTEAALRYSLRRTFEQFPQIDGIVARFGEVYTSETPFHAGGSPIDYEDIHAPHEPGKNDPDLIKQEWILSHQKLIQVLREEVCEKAGKTLIYRQWDFGPLHTNPELYQAVTEGIEPHHDHLIFSFKHHNSDFLRKAPFNHTAGIGKHPQIVEVECPRNCEGKGAYPNYIAAASIDGWEEDPYCEVDQTPCRGLRGFYKLDTYAGVWTWSSPSGWEGPRMADELWAELNTYVISQWAQNPTRSEENIFYEYADTFLGLTGWSAHQFRRLCLLSCDAVLRGLHSMHQFINPWWTRDHFLGGPQHWMLKDFFSQAVDSGFSDRILAEKAEAVAIWRQIEAIAAQIKLKDLKRDDFFRTSCTYGRIKYSIIEQAFIIWMRAEQNKHEPGKYDEEIRQAIDRYDQYWEAWRKLEKSNELCSPIYLDQYPEYRPAEKKDLREDSAVEDESNIMHIVYGPGMGASVDAVRNQYT